MAYIRSANPDFAEVPVPGTELNYPHPAERRRGPIPMAFQVTSPFNKFRVLLPHALVLHVNPESLQESNAQKIERIQTRGGWVEQHWGPDLVELSASGSTGAFMNIKTGLSSILRQKTIAWDRYRDLHDLYLNNASVRDPYGNIVLQGDIMLMYDRGIFLGTFRTFELEETDDAPFVFSLNWTFKVTRTLTSVAANPITFGGTVPTGFQNQNQPTREIG